MPPAAKKNASVILYDVKTNPEFAEAAKKCLLNICASKWFMESKDCTKLLLLNSEETKNLVHDSFGKCPHVYEATGIVNYDPKLLMPHIENVSTAEADWLVGLAAALESLKEDFSEVKGVMTRQLLFITDLSTPVTKKEKRIAFVIENLNRMNVQLYILGPEVKIPQYLTSFEDVQQWAKNIEFVDDEEANPNLSIAKQIVQNTKGIICNLQVGQELFKCYTNRWGLQPWKVPLTIGTKLSLPTSTVRFLRPNVGPRMRAQTMSGVKEPWKWYLVDDLATEVPYSNVIGGVFKHGKFVALPEDVEKNFKYSGPRCFTVVGFTDAQNIPEFYMRGDGAHYVEAESKTFKLLVHVLAMQGKCAIARKVYAQNCRPKLVALLPQPAEQIFILVDLPYSNSIRASFVEQDISKAPNLIEDTNPGLDAMYRYLEKLDVTDTKNWDSSGSVKVPLAANLMDSVRLNCVTQRCLQKYLGEEIDFEATKIELPQFVDDDAPYKQFVPPRPAAEPKKRGASD